MISDVKLNLSAAIWKASAMDHSKPDTQHFCTDARAAIERIRSSDSDAVLFLEERLSAHDATLGLGAFLQHAPDRVRSEFETQMRKGPLFGLPIAVKDNIDVAGYASSAGTPALSGWFPHKTASVAERLIDSGATIFGKTGLHELAFGVTSNNRAFGTIRNPYDPDAIPGGSSGGSAVAVAAGVVPLALGTDTAGSCRLPAALCGCVGFRPSLGRYNSDGVIPLAASQDTIGVLAGTSADVRFVDSVVSRSPNTPRRGLSGARIGIPRRYYYDPIDDSISTSIEEGLGILRNGGATLIEADLPTFDEFVRATLGPIMLYEWPRDISVYLTTHRSQVRTWEIADAIAGARESRLFGQQFGARAISTQRYTSLIATEKVMLRECFLSYFASYRLDAMAVPTTPATAPSIECDEGFDLNGTRVPLLTLIRNTAPGSVIGWPSISVPAGLTDLKHPVGLMFEGPPGSDAALIDFACDFERIRGPISRPNVLR